jgi:hypothetical protein
VGRRGLDSSGSGYGPVTDCCEHGNEPSRLSQSVSKPASECAILSEETLDFLRPIFVTNSVLH